MNCPSIPRLPYELIWDIIRKTWESPLSAQDRIQLMSCSLLINKTWMSIFIRIASRDVHILCPSYFRHFMDLTRQDHHPYDSLKSIPNELCRSISIEIDFLTQEESNSTREAPMAQTLANMLYEIKITGALPNLRTIKVVYRNSTEENIFSGYYFIDLPEQVENLELEYVSTKAPHPPDDFRNRDNQIANQMRTSYPPWYLPTIRQLTCVGGGYDLLADIMLGSPRLEFVETDASQYHERSVMPVIKRYAIIPKDSAPRTLEYIGTTTRGGMGGHNRIH